MNLYIKVVNGQPVDHPSFEDNLIQAFGSIPTEYQPFTRIPQPTTPIGVYQKYAESYENPVYAQVDGTWQDTWTVVDMTADEKAAKIAAAKEHQPYPSWTFDEATCTWVAPIPQPSDAGTGTPPKFYVWDETSQAWQAGPTTPPPTDPVPPAGQYYKWNGTTQSYELADIPSVPGPSVPGA